VAERNRNGLGTGFAVLEVFEGPGLVRLGVGEVVERLGIGRSTASTTLAALAEAGYLARLADGRYAMGERLQRAFANALLRERARLEELRAETDRQVRRAARLLGAAGEALGSDGLAPVKPGGEECGAVGGQA